MLANAALAGEVEPEMAALADSLSAELAELKVEVAPVPELRPAG